MIKIEISILIATFNSQRTLAKVLLSINRQTLKKGKYEIIIVDGGSKDNTLKIAKKYKCRVIKNPMTEPMNAKYIGFHSAKGKYLLSLDHDEVLQNKKSLENRLDIFKRDKRVKAIHSSGYITPIGSSSINFYVNEYGDPFSFFIYRLTKDYRFFLKTMKKRYKTAYEDDNYILFSTTVEKNRAPLMELGAGGAMIDIGYVKKNFKKLLPIKELFFPHLHLHLLKINPYIAITKNDPLYHYSAESFGKYLKKLQWRVRNNIYFGNTSGAAGFLKREEFEGKNFEINKFLFIPYSLTLIPALLDSLFLVITRKNLVYLVHLPLSVITSFLIIYHYARKAFGYNPILTSYDGSRKISKTWN
jgi:glycosyltransferase involved in cell wall biosynthesis